MDRPTVYQNLFHHSTIIHYDFDLNNPVTFNRAWLYLPPQQPEEIDMHEVPEGRNAE